MSLLGCRIVVVLSTLQQASVNIFVMGNRSGVLYGTCGKEVITHRSCYIHIQSSLI